MIKRGEIYDAELNPVIGNEQGGLRPVLIVQNDTGNKHSMTTIVAPMTTRTKTKLPTHVKVLVGEVENTVLLEQVGDFWAQADRLPRLAVGRGYGKG